MTAGGGEEMRSVRKKISDWWTYHRRIVILGLFAAAFAVYAAVSFGEEEKTQLLTGMLINQVREDAVTDRMEAEILGGIGGNSETEEVFIDATLTMDAQELGKEAISDLNTQESMAKLTTYVYAHELDFLIAEAAVFDYYQNLNAFADLDGLLTREQYEALEDRLYAADGKAVGIRMDDTEFIKKYEITLDEPVIGIISGSERKDAAVKLIAYLFFAEK